MKLTAVLSHVDPYKELEILSKSGYTNVLLGCKELSRFGKLALDQLEDLAINAKSLGLNPVLEWDILMTENDFKIALSHLVKLDLTIYSAVRVQDAGAIHFLFEHKFPIQLNLERGHHNLKAIKVWEDLLGDQLKLINLSIELSKDVLKNLKQNLKTPLEYSVFGRILLFYTPRSLLSPLYTNHEDPIKKTMIETKSDYIEAQGTSEESPHKGFPLIENRHGTFMFNTKDQCVLENVTEITDLGMDCARVDLRFFQDKNLYQKISDYIKNNDSSLLEDIKSQYGTTVIKGFYNVNKSDALFTKLKNNRVARQDKNYVGEIIDAVKGEFLVLNILKGEIKEGQVLSVTNTEGKTKEVRLSFLKDTRQENLESASKGQIVLIPYTSSLTVRSVVYSL